jgi:hypothetical protein
MSDILAIRANNSGTLQLSISTETVKVQTEWKNLTNPTCAYIILRLSKRVLLTIHSQ